MFSLFKRTALILTTLLFFAMPLNAALSEGVPSAGDCTTFEMMVSADAAVAFEAEGGKIIKLTPEQTAAVTKAFEEQFGKPPYEIGYAIILLKSDFPVARVAWMTSVGCMLGIGSFSGDNFKLLIDTIGRNS